MLRRNQGGFTLVELMIVVIIVGILAAVAIPMYQGATERAKASEAVAALGTIRGAMRVYFAEHGTYVITGVAIGDQVTNPGVLDVTDTDLLGRYFSTECYTFDAIPGAATCKRPSCDQKFAKSARSWSPPNPSPWYQRRG